MRTVEPLNIDRKDHALFMYDLALACKEDFLNDVDNDEIVLMEEYKRRIAAGDVVAFLAKVDGRNVGIVWVEMDRYGVGRVRAGMMPSERKGFAAMHFLREFIDFCFGTLNLRKLDAEIPLYGREKRSSLAAEKILRRFGFVKEGILRESLMIGGIAKDTVLLALTRNRHKGLRKHVKA